MRRPILLLLVTLLGAPGPASAQTAVANWLGTGATPDWHDPANWDTGIVPDNGNGGFDWDVVVSAPGATPEPTLSQDVTLASLYVDRVEIDLAGHTLTVEGPTTMVETSPYFFPDSSFVRGTLQMNGALAFAGDNQWAGFYDMLVVHAGDSTWADASIFLSIANTVSTFRNEGTIVTDRIRFLGHYDLPLPFWLENHGTIVQTVANGEIEGNFENHGLFDVTGSLEFRHPLVGAGSSGGPLVLRQVGGLWRMRGSGRLYANASSPRLAVESGLIEGLKLSFLPIDLAGVLAPGFDAPARLEFDDKPGQDELVMLPGSALEIELGGTAITEFDRVFAENIQLDGELHVSFVNGFDQTVTADDSLLIIASSAGLQGEFSNVADGGTLQAQGVRFRVDYFANTVVLSDFVWVGGGGRTCGLGPELAIALPLLAGLRRARRARARA